MRRDLDVKLVFVTRDELSEILLEACNRAGNLTLSDMLALGVVAHTSPAVSDATGYAFARFVACPARQAGIWGKNDDSTTPGGSSFTFHYDRLLFERFGRNGIILVVDDDQR